MTSIIGEGLQPDNEFIGSYFNNTHESLRLVAYTIEDLPGMTSGRNLFALGSFRDANFGAISVDLISQIDEMFRSDTVPADFLGIDSVVMILIYANVYPFQEVSQDLHPFTISIGELVDPVLIGPLTLARTYFSDDFRAQKNGGGTIVSNLEVRPNLRDTLTTFDTILNNDTIVRIDTIRSHVPMLRIPIYTSNNPNINGRDFGDRLLRTSAKLLPQSSDTSASFLSEIPGLYIQTHPEQVDGRGNIVNFDFTGNIATPQIRVYYRHTRTISDTLGTRDTIISRTKLYSIGFWGGMTYNYINIDRSTQSGDLANQINGTDTALGQNMVFLQSFFGSLARVEMPDIHRLSELAFTIDSVTGDTIPMRMVINQASLVLHPSSNGRFTPTASFGLGILTDTVINDTIMNIDRNIWRSQNIRDHQLTIGGVHDTRRNEYRIILTRHIQNLLLDPDVENPPLTIFPSNRLFFPDITSIYGPGLPVGDNRRMRLEIVYTLLPK